MKRQHVKQLIQSPDLLRQSRSPQLIETHISWVILTDVWAYKIKKPLSYPFLDFSSLAKRKYYCEQELSLNRRLCKNMYVGIQPIYGEKDQAVFSFSPPGEIIEYAVVMRRLDSHKQMDYMLKHNLLTTEHITALSQVLLRFHKTAKKIRKGLDPEKIKEDFEAISDLFPFIKEEGLMQVEKEIRECLLSERVFLSRMRQNISDRIQQGMIRDCHGDLHSGNVFIYSEPIIFDCIEFNPSFRQIDIMSEVSFLAMDLEFYQRPDLAKCFLQSYLAGLPEEDRKDADLWIAYYKMYRANVRAKVHFLQAQQALKKEKQKQLQIAQRYVNLMVRYSRELPHRVSCTSP